MSADPIGHCCLEHVIDNGQFEAILSK